MREEEGLGGGGDEGRGGGGAVEDAVEEAEPGDTSAVCEGL